MMQMKRALLVAAASVALGGLAYGGTKYVQPVYIDLGAQYAYGSMGSARNSVDSTQYIACSFATQASGVTGYCQARDANGTNASCFFSNNLNHEKALMGMTADARIFFMWKPDGSCDYIQIYAASMYEPKK